MGRKAFRYINNYYLKGEEFQWFSNKSLTSSLKLFKVYKLAIHGKITKN
jgi:hypothetical protein